MSFENPVLSLPAFERLQALDELQRAALEAILRDLGRKNKAPMATYWKCVSVYSNHIARALR